MIKLSHKTIYVLAVAGDPIAAHHIKHNRFYQNGGFVTSNGLTSLTLAEIEARMNSFGYEPKKSQSKANLYIVNEESVS